MTKALIAAVVMLLLPMVAAAQTTQGPLVLERLHSPFVVTPDYKITDIDGDTGQLAGAYAGKLLGDILFVGGGFYWLVDGDHGEEMRYGGLVLGWSMPAGRVVRFGARGLVGFGTATLGVDGQLIGEPRGRLSLAESRADRAFPGTRRLLRVRTAGERDGAGDPARRCRSRRRLSSQWGHQRARGSLERRQRQRRRAARVVVRGAHSATISATTGR